MEALRSDRRRKGDLKMRIWAQEFQRRNRKNEWWVRFKDTKGVEHKTRIAPDTFEGKRMAKKWAADYELKNLRQEMGFELENTPLETFYKKYLAQKSVENSASFIGRIEIILEHFRTFLSKKYPNVVMLQDLTHEIFLEYQLYRAHSKGKHTGRQLRRKTVNFELSTLATMMRRAVEWKLIKNNPCRVHHLKETDSKIVRAFTTDELTRLLAVIERESPWLYGPVLTGYYAGLRKGEITWLEWSDVDLEQGVIHIRRKDGWVPKSSGGEIREREVFIADELKIFLLSHRLKTRALGDNWVFHNPKGGQLTRHFALSFRAFCEKLDIAGVTEFHALRHSFGSHLAKNGVELPVIMELMGHASIKTTQRYLTAFEEQKRAGVNTLNIGVNTDAIRMSKIAKSDA
jgi:integrase